MRYRIVNGELLLGKKQLLRIKGTLCGAEKKILQANGKVLFQTEIMQCDAIPENRGVIPHRRYFMKDQAGITALSAIPEYATSEDPAVFGWPVVRLPKMDHAQVIIGRERYVLTMITGSRYTLTAADGTVPVRISHCGWCGGWDLEVDSSFGPEVLCGIYVFCRYLEKENELPMV